MKSRLPLLALVLALACWPGGAGADERFPVLAWQAPPAELDRYREMADAGFTHCIASAAGVADAVKLLDLAHRVGVKLVVTCPELSNDPEGTARRLKEHPALGGYFLRDEPSAADFAALGKWAGRLREADPAHPCLINLFPNYATPAQLGTPDYQTHLNRFAAEVPVPLISFDHYPVIATAGGVGVRGEWYDNLERVAQLARGAGKPFWAFALSVAHDPYPVATVPHLRLQVYTNLAYGAQGIQYFTYWTPVSTHWNFHEGPVTADGKRTPVYDRVRQVNREIQARRRVFQGSRVLSVGHTGDAIPVGTRRYEPVAPIRSVRTGGHGAVVSLLANGPRRFLVVVNRDVNHPTTLAAESDGSAKLQSIDRDGAAHDLPAPTFEAAVEPGDAVILSWEDGPQ